MDGYELSVMFGGRADTARIQKMSNVRLGAKSSHTLPPTSSSSSSPSSSTPSSSSHSDSPSSAAPLEYLTVLSPPR